MSSNTSKGRGKKGSKFWVQTIINSDMKIELERQIGIGNINWISPLAKDNYIEYKLNQDYISELIGVPKSFYDFWPSNQPQWDAIGITEDVIVLVEAKAHLQELNSNLSAKSEKSKILINESMRRIYGKYYSNGNFGKWIRGYYQLGNRLTFLRNMNDLVEVEGRKVKLIFLNIINDPTHIPTSEVEWDKMYKDIFMDMTGLTSLPKDVIMVNYSVE